MTDDITSIWRAALKDSEHPRHRAAWLLFTASSNAHGIARMLDEQKETVIPWLYEILDDEELCCEGSFGDGWGPINAVRLLGAWQVTEALPRLLKLVVPIPNAVHARKLALMTKAANAAVAAMPESITPQLLAFAKRQTLVGRMIAARLLAIVANENDEVHEWIKSVFLAEKQDGELSLLAQVMLDQHAGRAILFLEEWLKKARISQHLRKQILEHVEDVRAANSP